MAIGYAEGTTAGHAGVGVLHRSDAAEPGFALYASGHGPEAVLMDLDGNELHRWHHDFWATWPDAPVSRSPGSVHNFRRVRLLPDGSLLAIHEGLGIVRLGPDDVPIWAELNGAHHDAVVRPNGTVMVLVRRPENVPWLSTRGPVLADAVAILDVESGVTLRRISILEAFKGKAQLLQALGGDDGDPLHTNSIEVLSAPLRGTGGRAGDLLLSLRTPSLLAVIDVETGALLWSSRGPFRQQHDARVDGPSAVLIFDNSGSKEGARVLRLDVPQPRVLRSWGPEVHLHSPLLGAVARLPGGHVMVTESEGGRAFEVGENGEVVWEFHNPHRAGDNDEWVAALFELVRLPADFPVDWARGVAVPPRGPDGGSGCW